MHDPRECPGCEKRAKERMERYFTSLKAVLATQAGREVLDVILDRSGVHAPSLWEPSSRINYLTARRDFGQEIVNDIAHASFSAWVTMQQDRFNAAEIEVKAHEADEKQYQRRGK